MKASLLSSQLHCLLIGAEQHYKKMSHLAFYKDTNFKKLGEWEELWDLLHSVTSGMLWRTLYASKADINKSVEIFLEIGENINSVMQ